MSESPLHVAHFITRMIVGGAQENTLWTVLDQHQEYGDRVTLISGVDNGPEGELLTVARNVGVNVEIIPELGRSLHPWKDWKSYRALIRLLRSSPPQVLHTHSSKAGILGRSAARKLKIPVVHTIHGAAFHYGQPALLHNLYQRAERWAGKRTDHFITVCDAMRDQYLEAGIRSPENYTTIYSGMDVDPFLYPSRPVADIRKELGILPEDIVVGKIARLFHLKGHHFVIEAAKKIVPKYPHVKFMFVGDGVLRDEYHRQIDEAGLSDHFIFTGLVPPQEVPDLIHAMDMVVHTSEWEGLARVLVQGLLAGKPVVSFDIDGAKEVVIPNETGFLVPFGETDQLTESLITLVEDRLLGERLGQVGRQRFTDIFRHQTMTRGIRDEYFNLLAGKE